MPHSPHGSHPSIVTGPAHHHSPLQLAPLTAHTSRTGNSPVPCSADQSVINKECNQIGVDIATRGRWKSVWNDCRSILFGYSVGVLEVLLLCGLLCGFFTVTSSNSLMMCPVPLPCHCIGDETIYCAFKRMKELPYFLDFNGVWNTMNLSDNLLPTLPGNKFVGGRIRQLDLSRNIIASIHVEAFVGLSDLETLELSYNYLSDISGEALSPLVDLRTLRLRYNRFKWISATTFRRITQLHHLDLSGNDLDTVPSGALRPLVHLKILKLRNNKIKKIHSYAFEGLPLETLDLGDNESPMTLDPRTFCGQEPKVSHEARNVMEWDGMYTLLLDHNGLSFIDPCIAKLVWTLTTFDISGNPLRCDCRLYMFRNWGTRTTFPHAQCDSPLKFAGEMIDTLDQSRFNCSHREQYARCDNLCVSLTPIPKSNLANPLRNDALHRFTLLMISISLCLHLLHYHGPHSGVRTNNPRYACTQHPS